MAVTLTTTSKSSNATINTESDSPTVDAGADFLLKEDGDFVLKEDGDKIILEPNDLARPGKSSNATISNVAKS